MQPEHARGSGMALRLIPPPPAPAAQIAPCADAALAAALAQCQRLVDRATAPGLAFALDDLSSIELPEPAAARIDRAQLRALASLYLAADLEAPGIIAAVESLAGLSTSGAIQVDLGGAGPLVAAWWRARHEQLTAEERNAFFARLFGTSSGPVSAETGRNTRFEDRMFELAEALVKLEEEGGMNPSGGIRAQSRVRSAARNLSHNLSDHSGGATAFIASEVMKTLKDAFAVLSHPAMRSAFHARDLWEVVRGIARAGGQLQLPDAQPYVRRGKAGMILISWLADRLEAISGNAPLVELADPVIAAAVDWLEATLALADGAAPAPSPATQNGQPASVWSALAD